MSKGTSVIVNGWRFTGYPNGVYVDVTPPGCRTAIEAVYVGGEPVQDRTYLGELGSEWLKVNHRNLQGYIESAAWYDAVEGS
jgi:hypothetical protein